MAGEMRFGAFLPQESSIWPQGGVLFRVSYERWLALRQKDRPASHDKPMDGRVGARTGTSIALRGERARR